MIANNRSDIALLCAALDNTSHPHIQTLMLRSATSIMAAAYNDPTLYALLDSTDKIHRGHVIQDPIAFGILDHGNDLAYITGASLAPLAQAKRQFVFIGFGVSASLLPEIRDKLANHTPWDINTPLYLKHITTASLKPAYESKGLVDARNNGYISGIDLDSANYFCRWRTNAVYEGSGFGSTIFYKTMLEAYDQYIHDLNDDVEKPRSTVVLVRRIAQDEQVWQRPNLNERIDDPILAFYQRNGFAIKDTIPVPITEQTAEGAQTMHVMECNFAQEGMAELHNKWLDREKNGLDATDMLTQIALSKESPVRATLKPETQYYYGLHAPHTR